MHFSNSVLTALRPCEKNLGGLRLWYPDRESYGWSNPLIINIIYRFILF